MDILKDVIDYYNNSGIDSKSRKQHHLFRRFYLMNYLYKVGGYTYISIGEAMSKNYTTVINAVKQSDQLERYRSYRDLTRDERIKFPMNDYLANTDDEFPRHLLIVDSMTSMQLIAENINFKPANRR